MLDFRLWLGYCFGAGPIEFGLTFVQILSRIFILSRMELLLLLLFILNLF